MDLGPIHGDIADITHTGVMNGFNEPCNTNGFPGKIMIDR